MQDGKLAWYLTTVVNTQLRATASPLVRETLELIGKAAPMPYTQALQLLALRRYVRLQNRDHRDLASLWSWTPEQVNHSLVKRLMNEAARVQRAFASANPGYTLALSPPRDLARQVQLWNDSLDGRAAGRLLHGEAVKELSRTAYDLPAHLARVAEFARWLQFAPVTPEPGNAAPGTSEHGRMSAVDFIVMQGSRVVATTRRATIASDWTAAGWTAKLAAATAGTQLVGPLPDPYEPWHWSLR